MPKINLLTPHVADLIAAGEVVERPGSVIKELVENSIDAGATSITIEIKRGGMTFLRVADNGGGMSPEDAGIAFLRHATSKLYDESGLEAIGTLGFRGEALSAISAVSHIELLTREKKADEGIRMLLEAGDILEMAPVGCPAGTAITVRDLFYNTPARLKFMKSDRAESAGCLAAALRCALGAPGVSVRCIRDEKEEFFSPGDGRLESCVYSLLGREFSLSLLEARSDDGDVSVSGFVSAPAAARGSRGGQFFFCNGRNIRSKTLTAALEQAYKNSIMSGRFPSCVLYISLRPSSIDVNVHPAKIEVKFSDERKVFDAVYYAALSALGGGERNADIVLSAAVKKIISHNRDASPDLSCAQYKISEIPQDGGTEQAHPKKALDNSPLSLRDRGGEAFTTAAAPPFTSFSNSPSLSAREPEPIREPLPCPRVPVGAEPGFRIVGEAMETYIIAEKENQLVLVDKHAAHERVIFDRLLEQGREIMSQALLSPFVLSPQAKDYDILLNNLDLLNDLGFELEPYGDSALILRAIPSEADEGDASAMLEEICLKLRRGGFVRPGAAKDEVLRSVACKAAIKAGSGSEPEELFALCERVLSGEIKYCPHGRPVSALISKKELDKYFERS